MKQCWSQMASRQASVRTSWATILQTPPSMGCLNSSPGFLISTQHRQFLNEPTNTLFLAGQCLNSQTPYTSLHIFIGPPVRKSHIDSPSPSPPHRATSSSIRHADHPEYSVNRISLCHSRSDRCTFPSLLTTANLSPLACRYKRGWSVSCACLMLPSSRLTRTTLPPLDAPNSVGPVHERSRMGSYIHSKGMGDTSSRPPE